MTHKTRQDQFEFLMKNHNNNAEYVIYLIDRDETIKAEIKKRYGRKLQYDIVEYAPGTCENTEEYTVITSKGHFNIIIHRTYNPIDYIELNNIERFFRKIHKSGIKLNFKKINDPLIQEYNNKLDEYLKCIEL